LTIKARDKEIKIRTYVFIDLSNLLSFIKDSIVPKRSRNKWSWTEPTFGRIFGNIILESFKEIPIEYKKDDKIVNSYTSYFVKPFRIYLYGSCTPRELRSFKILIDVLKVSSDVIPYMIIRGRKQKEKTVDVRLAVDMLTYAIEDKFDLAILVTGDSDFVPAVERVRDLGKKIYISQFYGYASYKLIEVADRYLPLDYEYISLGQIPHIHVPLDIFSADYSELILNKESYGEYFIEALNENINELCKNIICPDKIDDIISYLGDYGKFKTKITMIGDFLYEFIEKIKFKPADELIKPHSTGDMDIEEYINKTTSVQRSISRLIFQCNILYCLKDKLSDKF